jgi:hypothetical protein
VRKLKLVKIECATWHVLDRGLTRVLNSHVFYQLSNHTRISSFSSFLVFCLCQHVCIPLPRAWTKIKHDFFAISQILALKAYSGMSKEFKARLPHSGEAKSAAGDVALSEVVVALKELQLSGWSCFGTRIQKNHAIVGSHRGLQESV